MRAIGRARGKTVLGWWIAPEQDVYAQLEALGLVNEDGGGFEAIEYAMALVAPPPVAGGRDVTVRQVGSFDEFVGAARVAMEAFEMPTDMREELEAASNNGSRSLGSTPSRTRLRRADRRPDRRNRVGDCG